MKRNTIRWVIVMAIVSVVGIVVIQYYWFTRAFDVEEEQFSREVNTALYNVASRFFEINQAAIPANNPIKQLSTNYYVVMINNEIDANLLEFLLRTEFEKRSIDADFEYGIYDCTSDKMVYGNYVSFENDASVEEQGNLPKWENQNYYFGVQFPNKASIITNRMGIWIFSSSVLLVVILFFSYAVFVILKQKRLSEIQKDFINNMTHEFKTPISTIALSADVLKNPEIGGQPERLLNYATIIEKENNRLKNQVERVLQMAQVEKEELALKKESLDVHELIKEAVNSISVALSQNEGNIDLKLEARNSSITGDRLHLINMVFNLLDNAVKYNERKPEIQIRTENKDNELLVHIQDNGIGIGKEHQKHIFKKFFRIPTGNIHNVKGFGLGLNYVALIVDVHGGKITMQSEEGQGTTFTIRFKNG